MKTNSYSVQKQGWNYRIYGVILLLISLGVVPKIAFASNMQISGTSNDTSGTYIGGQSRITDALFYKVDVEKKISVHLEEETVENALKEIARKTGLRLTYAGRINSNNQITLVSNSISISEALAAILKGTNLEPRFSSLGYLLITSTEYNISSEAGIENSDESQEQPSGYGTIAGEVRDASTGETLPGANVVVKGTNIGVATDIDGRFTLRRVPAGNQVLDVRYMGFLSLEIPLTVPEEERLTQNIELEPDMIIGDEVFVMAWQRGQARALTRQRESVNICNVISSEQIDAFADETVSGALRRVVGMGHGGANIRGVGAAASNITMDGQRMGSTGSDRSVDLSTISADMVQELDVIKVVTPDMDADALSGVINVSTRRPIGGDRSMNIRVGGGMQDRYYRHLGAATRTSFSYGDSPTDNFTYGFNFGYQRSPTATEQVQTDWAGRTWDDVGRVDVVSNFHTQLQFDVRDRYSAGYQMTFQPTDRSTYHVQSMFNYQQREQRFHTVRYNITVQNYMNQFVTCGGYACPPGGGGTTNQSNMYFDQRLDEPVTHQYTVQFGGRHLLDRFDVGYILGWGHGRHHSDSYRLPIRTPSRFNYVISNIDVDRQNIQVDIADDTSEWQAYPEPDRIRFIGHDHRISRHQDNEFTTGLDVTSPYHRGTIKIGASGLFTFRMGEGERFNGGFDRRLNANELEWVPNASWQIFDREHQSYSIPWMIDLQKAKDLYYGQRPHFDINLDTWMQEVETSQYRADEHTLGTYVMADVSFGRLVLLGGARVEHSINEYDGRQGSISKEGRYRGAVDVSSLTTFTNVFPNAQAVYNLTGRTNMRAAFSRTIGRPTFGQLSPNSTRNYSNQTISQGNPNLKPMLANNLDFIVDHYFMQVGQLSLGVFFKDLTDFVYSRTDILRGGTPDEDIVDEIGGKEGMDEDHFVYEGWRRTTYVNGEDAYVYGLEFSWQHDLSFLPGFLGNFHTYTNYAYTQSFADIGRFHADPARSTEKLRVPLRDMRPHVVNVGLGYIQGAFSTQVSYYWGSPSISSYQDPQWVPQIHQRHREYFDRYRDAANDLSMTLRYRISTNIRLWADASNILNQRRIDYYFDQEFYPYQISLNGRRINVGLRYTF